MSVPREAAREVEMTASDMTASVEAARQRWNAGDLPGYLSLYDASIRLHGYSPAPMDKQAVTGFYQTIWAGLPAEGRASPLLEFHEVLTEGVLYSCRFTMSGMHKGPFMGVPATGKPYALGGISIMRFADGKVVERWSSADMLGLMVQIGAIPPPV
jgi:predicted ester cyclase